ncbi:thiamine phosphate synthase [Carnobacteriaceae bacterium 52-44]
MVRNDLDVYFIAGSQDVKNGDLLPVLENALQAGITMFQFREKGPNSFIHNPEMKRELAIQCQALCNKYNIPFIINDDVELAISIKADGIHVGQDDTPIEEVLKRVGLDMIVGLSTSNAQEVADAEKIEGLDYIGLGPVFATTSKEDTDPVLGIKGLKDIIGQGRKRPIVAIGGLSTDNASDVRKSGVDGLAVISAMTKSNNMMETVEQLKGNRIE